MTFQKLKANFLFDGYCFRNTNEVLITDEKGEIIDIIDELEAGDNIQHFEGILSPGFVNCHCHLELSHMKGLIPEKTGLIDFVFKVVTERHHSEEVILQAIANAEQEMMTNGIVAVGDICNNTLTIQQKQKGNLQYYNFIEVSGWLPEIALQRFEKSKELYESFSQLQNLKFKHRNALTPHAPYSVSENLWQLLESEFENKTITIHNQETVFEDALFKNKSGDFIRMYERMKLDNSFFKPTGKSSICSVLPHFKKAKKVLLVHNTFIQEQDIEAINNFSAKYQVQFFYCLCVRANSYIENAYPHLQLLLHNNCTITIGTDSLASNWGLSMIDELKSIKHNFPSISTETMLQWATLNGASALNMQQTLGSFDKGKQPGIALIKNIKEKNITQDSKVQIIKKIV
jgi:cytosine/adenosine deaminase-related metal-dependent hydrolase